MKRILAIYAALFGAVCMVIAMMHIAIGPTAIPGGVPVNPPMDSEDRFYATLFLGFGATCIWCARDLAARKAVFGWLMLVFFVGGVARVVSALAVGLPNDLFIGLGLIELLQPPLLWWLIRRAFPD